jgi:DNA-binding response OmpR family regulator
LPAVGIVVLSTHSENVYRRAALEAGANEVVVKSGLIAELLPAMRQVVRKDRQRRRRGKHP